MDDAATGAIRYDHSDDSLRFSGFNNAERLRIHSDGWCMLHTDTLGNNKNAKELVVSYNNTNVSSGDHGRAGITIRSGSNSSGTSQPGYLLFSDGTSGDNESIGGIKYDHFLDDMVFSANGNERLRINSDGKIGVNVSSFTSGNSKESIMQIKAPDAYAALGIGGTTFGITFGWDGDRSSYDDIRMYRVDYSNSGTFGIAANLPCFVLTPTSAPGSGIVQETVWLKSTGRGSGNNEMNLMVDGDVVVGGDGQVPGGSQSGYPSSLVGGLGVSKLTIQPDHRSTAFDAGDGDTWHDLVLHQGGSAADNAVGIAFELNNASAYHKNAGTGICAVKNGTNSDYGSDLVFITRPQSAVAKERVRISSTGLVGIGQDGNGNISPRAVLEINAPYDDVSDNDGSADLGTNGHDAILINISGPSAANGKNVGSIIWGHGRRRAAIMGEYQNTDSDYLGLAFFTRGSDGPNDFFKSFIINRDGSAGLHGSLSQNTSDDRLKKDKVEITNALDKVNSLSSFTHKWNEIAVRAGLEEGKEEIGLSAQEVQKVHPSLVNVNNVMKDPEDPDTDYLTVHYEKVVPLLVASIKELTAKNKALEARLDALEG